jgi:hypothetical protein
MIAIAAASAVMGIARLALLLLANDGLALLLFCGVVFVGGVLTAIIELVVFWIVFLSVRRGKNAGSVNRS